MKRLEAWCAFWWGFFHPFANRKQHQRAAEKRVRKFHREVR